ncbi:hypothetical protein [Actinocorallia libanotica]|uniref:NIPSNAP protein n=1 Tax=Actinocorallia libanotica TaxID=46162 RepID=A0ABP4BPU7_9ACTN
MNDKVYIHEFIHITKQNRARYMHHMTANWSPIAQEQRNQLCYGVWGVVGSTGPWPQTVNMWEEDGFDGLADSFTLEFGNKILQDPALEKWWAAAADLRSGGFDRIVVPHPETPTIEQLCAAGVRGEVYAHELVKVEPGTAWHFLDAAMAGAEAARERTGWRLVGAWATAMHNLDECLLLWAVPTWRAWGALEKAQIRGEDALLAKAGDLVRERERILLVDAHLSPFRTGRQPSREDRTDWTD